MKKKCIQIFNIYFVQSHKLYFLKPSYFYKIICISSEDSDQSVHLRSLITFHLTL